MNVFTTLDHQHRENRTSLEASLCQTSHYTKKRQQSKQHVIGRKKETWTKGTESRVHIYMGK